MACRLMLYIVPNCEMKYKLNWLRPPVQCAQICKSIVWKSIDCILSENASVIGYSTLYCVFVPWMVVCMHSPAALLMVCPVLFRDKALDSHDPLTICQLKQNDLL